MFPRCPLDRRQAHAGHLPHAWATVHARDGRPRLPGAVRDQRARWTRCRSREGGISGWAATTRAVARAGHVPLQGAVEQRADDIVIAVSRARQQVLGCRRELSRGIEVVSTGVAPQLLKSEFTG
jgi:hypothetical protein